VFYPDFTDSIDLAVRQANTPSGGPVYNLTFAHDERVYRTRANAAFALELGNAKYQGLVDVYLSKQGNVENLEPHDPDATWEYQFRSSGKWQTVAVGLSHSDVRKIRRTWVDTDPERRAAYRFVRETPVCTTAELDTELEQRRADGFDGLESVDTSQPGWQEYEGDDTRIVY